jgi:hypothetical protein
MVAPHLPTEILAANLRVTYRKVVFSATTYMQKKPLARAIQQLERRISRDKDWVTEQGGLETPVSREIFAKENPREYWRNLASKSVSIVPESEFAFSSVRFPSLTLNSGVARMPLGRKVPSDELKSSKELVEERFTRFGYETPVAVQQRRTGLIESEREPTNDQRVSAGAQRGQLLNSDPRQR